MVIELNKITIVHVLKITIKIFNNHLNAKIFPNLNKITIIIMISMKTVYKFIYHLII